MGYSVELYFDAPGEARLRELWKSLHDEEICKFMHESGGRPHIALTVFEEKECNIKQLRKSVLQFFERQKRFSLIFSSMGIFPGEEGVTFIGVKPTAQLIELQQAFFDDIKETSAIEQLWEYYMPEYWVPHCTMTIGTTTDEQLMAIDILRKQFRNFMVTVESVALVKFYPYECLEEIKLI